MFGFNVSKESFVATATAIGLFVDIFRMPVYAATHHREIIAAWPSLLIATAGVVAGTLAGKRVLQRVPENIFRMCVHTVILALGIWMLVRPGD
jgi:uncharacterized membrane protein YfcA